MGLTALSSLIICTQFWEISSDGTEIRTFTVRPISLWNFYMIYLVDQRVIPLQAEVAET